MDNQTKPPHRSLSDPGSNDFSSGKRKVLKYPSGSSSPGKRKILRYPEEKSQLFWKRLNPPLAALMLLGLFVAVGAVALSAIFLPTFPFLRRAPLPTEIAAGPTPTEKTAITEAPAALSSLPSVTPIPHIPTPTESATPKPPTAAPASTDTPTPAAAATPTVTPPCENKASFVKDITIPDSTQFPPNQSFTKIWRIRNDGSCTWGQGYTVVFWNRNYFGEQRSIELGDISITPHETLDVSVDMIAPNSPGKYEGRWVIFDQEKNLLPGLELSVVIRVVEE